MSAVEFRGLTEVTEESPADAGTEKLISDTVRELIQIGKLSISDITKRINGEGNESGIRRGFPTK